MRSLIAKTLLICLLTIPAAVDANVRPLPVVRPVVRCEQLLRAPIDQGELAGLRLGSATLVQTAQGSFCRVTGMIGPGTIRFEVYLPVDRWTQRYAQSAQNVLPVARAGSNRPALRGELVVAITDKGGPGTSRETLWTTTNLQKRIDWAYRGNHVTALAAKALIKAYYGRSQRFSYFIGCSMGGREVLSAVQRYPEDFDGAVAGAPVVVDALHNAFFPGWEWQANRRADGSIILQPEHLPVLHKAAIRHCAARSGLLDGILQHPGACTFDPAWVTCKPGAPNSSECLTGEAAEVARKLYTGPRDPQGRLLDAGGFPLGSEMTWRLSTIAGPANPATDPANALVRLLAPYDPAEDQEAMRQTFAFTNAWFERAAGDGSLVEHRQYRPVALREARRQADLVDRRGGYHCPASQHRGLLRGPAKDAWSRRN